MTLKSKLGHIKLAWKTLHNPSITIHFILDLLVLIQITHKILPGDLYSFSSTNESFITGQAGYMQ